MEFKETEKIELKKSLSQLNNSLKTVCAFLNHKGGAIYFGIDNKGKVIGQVATDSNLKKISQQIRSRISPQIIPKIEEVIIDNKPVIKITIEKGSNAIYYFNGIPYTRCGTETITITPDEIEKRIIRNNKINWESKICPSAKYSDLDINTINNFIKLAKETNRISISNEDTKLILKKLGLIKDSNGVTPIS